MGRLRFERRTNRLKACCSTDWANDPYWITFWRCQWYLFNRKYQRSKIVFLNSGNQHITVSEFTQGVLSAIQKSERYDFLSEAHLQKLTREEVVNFYDECISFFREKMLNGDKNSVPILKKIIRMKDLFESNNLNIQLSVDAILIYISKIFHNELDFRSWLDYY